MRDHPSPFPAETPRPPLPTPVPRATRQSRFWIPDLGLYRARQCPELGRSVRPAGVRILDGLGRRPAWRWGERAGARLIPSLPTSDVPTVRPITRTIRPAHQCAPTSHSPSDPIPDPSGRRIQAQRCAAAPQARHAVGWYGQRCSARPAWRRSRLRSPKARDGPGRPLSSDGPHGARKRLERRGLRSPFNCKGAVRCEDRSGLPVPLCRRVRYKGCSALRGPTEQGGAKRAPTRRMNR
jgi:hypothetical protein